MKTNEAITTILDESKKMVNQNLRIPSTISKIDRTFNGTNQSTFLNYLSKAELSLPSFSISSETSKSPIDLSELAKTTAGGLVAGLGVSTLA